MTRKLLILFFAAIFFCAAGVSVLRAQDDSKNDNNQSGKSKKNENSAETSVGGKEHEAEIVGVKIGMDVPTALQAVFINADRKAGQEKPDAQRKEGKDNKDIRVLYKNLPQGELQIVFAEGKVVKEIVLKYALGQTTENLRLAANGGTDAASGGARFDDRYTIGFTNSKKEERLWWRDEKTDQGYRRRVAFTSANLLKSGSVGQNTIVYKTISVTPGDEVKFADVYLK